MSSVIRRLKWERDEGAGLSLLENDALAELERAWSVAADAVIETEKLRDLLRRYIARVTDEEGYNLIPSPNDDRTNGGAPTVSFTEEEVALLRSLAT